MYEDNHRSQAQEGAMQISSVKPELMPPTAIPARVATSQVSAAALQHANGDGDGRTGAAALNDGDAAAHAAAQQVRAGSRIDVRV
jgi:hypothetical protein